MAETLPPPDPTVKYGNFASAVRQFGLSPAVKAYVTEITGNEKVYDDLAEQGLSDLNIANDFFKLDGIDPTSFIEGERREGLSLEDSARLLSQDMNIDFSTLQKEQDISVADFLEFFTKGRRLEGLDLALETAGRGAVSGSSMAAGAGTGALIGMATPLPFATPVFTILGGLGGAFAAEEIKEEVFPQEPIIVPGSREKMVFGETLIEALMGTSLLKAGRETSRFVFDKVGDEFKNRGFFADRLREGALARNYNVVKTEAYRPSGATPALGVVPMERYMERIAKEDPVLFAYLRSYQKNPKATIAAEAAGGLGAATGAFVAEREFPGDPVMRGALELGFATPLSYASLFPYFVLAKDRLGGAVDRARGTLTQEEQEKRVGRVLVGFFEEMGEDPQDFITALDNGTFVRSIEDTLAAHDARFADLTEDQIADLPMTTRMLASLDSNDLRENVSLDLLEATIRKKVPFEDQKFVQNYNLQTRRIRDLIAALSTSENPDALQVAGDMRLKLFKDTIQARLDQATNDQRRVVANFGTGASNAAARREAGRKLDSVMEGAFNDIREQQKRLYDQIPQDLSIGEFNLINTIREISAELPPEARADVLPKIVRGTEKRFNDRINKARLENEISQLDTDLAELKSYQGFVREGPLQGTNIQTPPEVRDRLAASYDVRFDQVEKEIKDRLEVAQEANQKLGDIDDTPLTRQQMSKYRSLMLGEARKAGADGQMEIALLYSRIADAIEEDFADVGTITQLNDISLTQQGKLNAQIGAANSFTRAFKDAFSRSFPNKLQKERRTGEVIINPELLYKEIIRGGTVEQDIKMEQISDAVTFLQRSLVGDTIGGPSFRVLRPGQVEEIEKTTAERLKTMDEAYEDIFRALARSKIVNVRQGEEAEINLPALRVFIDENEQMLDRIPNLKRDLLDAKTARVALNRVLEDEKQGELPEFFISRLFQQVTGDRPDQAIEKLIGSDATRPREQFFDTLAKLRTQGLFSVPEETVEERLKTAVLSWARGRSLGKRPGEPFGEVTDPALLDETAAAFEGVAETPNFLAMYNSLFSTDSGGQSVMSILSRPGPDGQPALFSSLERLNLQKILKRGIELQRTVLNPRFKDVVEEVAPDVNLLTGLLIKLSGSQIGSSLARFIPGRGQGLIEAGAGVRFLEKMLAPIPSNAVDEILLRAAKEPEFMRYILNTGVIEKAAEGTAKKPPGSTLREQIKEIKRLRSYLLPVLGTVADEILSESEEEILQGRFEGFEEQRTERYEPFVPPQPVAPPIAPPVSAAMPAPVPTAPNPQLRQRFAALYPDDPISPLIEAQGIGTLPQARV